MRKTKAGQNSRRRGRKRIRRELTEGKGSSSLSLEINKYGHYRVWMNLVRCWETRQESKEKPLNVRDVENTIGLEIGHIRIRVGSKFNSSK